MENIIYLDTNALTYAWRAGGEELLGIYKASAEASGFKLAITDVVEFEINYGPLKDELTKWLAEQNILPEETAEGARYQANEQALGAGQPTGDYNPKNAGERSISEMAGKAKAAGQNVKVLSDDKWFSNRKLLNQYGLTPEIGINNADMLNESAISGKVSLEDFERFKGGFKTQPPYDALGGSYSQRLDRFLSADEVLSIRDGGAISKGILPKFGHGLKVLGLASLFYDIGTSSADAAEAAKTGNTDKAANIMVRLAARIYFGFEAGLAGAALGGAIGAPGGFTAIAGMIIGGAVGGVAGAVAGDTAVDAIWQMSDRVMSFLQGTKQGQETASEAGIVLPTPLASGEEVYQRLVAAGIPSGQAHRITDSFAADYKRRVVSGISISANDLIAEIIDSAKANQAIAETDDDGTLITHISGQQMEKTITIDADGKARKSELNPDGGGTEVRLDRYGKLSEQMSFSSSGTIFKRFDVSTGEEILNVAYDSEARLSAITIGKVGNYKRLSLNYGTDNSVTLDGFSLKNINQVWSDFIGPLDVSGDESLATDIEKFTLNTIIHNFPTGFGNSTGFYGEFTIDRVSELSVENGIISLNKNNSHTTLKFNVSNGNPLERKDYHEDGNPNFFTVYAINNEANFQWKTDYFKTINGQSYISDTETKRKDGYVELSFYEIDQSWIETSLYSSDGHYIETLSTIYSNPPPTLPKPAFEALIIDPSASITFSPHAFVSNTIQSRLGLTTEQIGQLNTSEIRTAIPKLRYDQVIPFLSMLSLGQISTIFPSPGGSGAPVAGSFISVAPATVTIVDGGVTPISGMMDSSALFNYVNNVYQYSGVTPPSTPIVVPPLPDIPPIVIPPSTPDKVFVILSSIVVNGTASGAWAYPDGTYSNLILYEPSQQPQGAMLVKDFDANPPWK